MSGASVWSPVVCGTGARSQAKAQASSCLRHMARSLLLAGIDVSTARRRQDRVITSACLIYIACIIKT